MTRDKLYDTLTDHIEFLYLITKYTKDEKYLSKIQTIQKFQRDLINRYANPDDNVEFK